MAISSVDFRNNDPSIKATYAEAKAFIEEIRTTSCQLSGEPWDPACMRSPHQPV